MMVLLFVSVGTVVQAQQSAFQGTWLGQRDEWIDRTAYRIVISGNTWQEFYNNQIEASGMARFSSGRAELFLADGRLAWDLRLLAPGLIEQPIGWTGLYRFRLAQSNSNSQSAPTMIITENLIDGNRTLTYSLSNNLNEIEKAIFSRTGRNIRLDNVNWLNITGNLWQEVITMMNKHNVNYSMVTVNDNKTIIVNKRVGDNWYWYVYDEP